MQTDGTLMVDIPVCPIVVILCILLILSQDRLNSFMCMVREWRHCKQLKRAGRGHDVGGIAATKEGELAVPCRACSQHGQNLPQGWENDEEKQYVVNYSVLSQR